jgi:4a-hydroxytetrahydrobiopterin dehydratase
MVEVKDISPSAGEDPEVLARQTTELIDHGRWRLCNDGKGLERLFKFKTFKATWVGPLPLQYRWPFR